MPKDHTKSDIGRSSKGKKASENIIIYVEGRNTEPDYLNLLKSNCLVKPIVKKGGGIGSCMDFVNEVDKAYQSLKHSLKDKYKQKWMMFDYDGHDDFKKAIKEARERGFKVAFSSMCIEYWFMLHFYMHDGPAIPMKGTSHSQAQIEQINSFIAKYNKKAKKPIALYDAGSKDVEEDFMELMLSIDPNTKHRRIEDAFERAKKIHENKKGNGCEFDESVTTIYELLLELGVLSYDESKKRFVFQSR